MKDETMSRLPGIAAIVLACTPFAAIGAEVTPALPLGQTISVTGTTDAAPTACDVSAVPAVSCANLRSAVAHANANGNEATEYDRIVLANGSTHVLSVADAGAAEAIEALDNAVGDLDLTTPMSIETADNTLARATIEGGTGFGDRLLQINAAVLLDNLVLTKGQGVFMNGGAIYAGDLGNTTVNRCLITDNFASWDALDGTGELQGSGGGIYSKGVLNVSLSTLSANTARTLRNGGLLEGDKIGNGGAIYASQATTIVDSTLGGAAAGNIAINGGGIQMAGGNKLEVLRSTLSHNDAISGGAINVVSPSVGPFTVTNATISSNHVTDSGAGINTNAAVSILNTTIADNVKDSGNKGAGINLVGGTALLKNTLLANNLGGGASANCGKTGTGALATISGGGNVSTDATCGLTFSTDQQSVADAAIGPLALNDNVLNGTFTHALLTGSPAIDKAINDGCPSSDQRGVVRPFDALVIGSRLCDAGAYELFIDRQDLAIASMVADPARVPVDADTTLGVRVANTAATNATAVALSTTLPAGVSFVSGPAGCTATSATQIDCTLGTIAPASSAEVALVLTVSGAGNNVVTSTVSATSVDPIPANNTASATLVGLTDTDLNLTAAGTSFVAGGQGVVVFTVQNQGAAVARNVVLTGSVPASMTVVSVTNGGACTVGAAAFSCTVAEILAAQGQAVGVTVASSTAGVYSVAAQVSGDVIDADAADNAAAATASVAVPAGGGGCSMARGNSPGDPLLPTLAALALLGLALRRVRRS